MTTLTTLDRCRRGDFTNNAAFTRENSKAYNERNDELRTAFKESLFAEHGIAHHPKREKLFSLAWANGHAYSFAEVVLHFEDMLELIK